MFHLVKHGTNFLIQRREVPFW